MADYGSSASDNDAPSRGGWSIVRSAFIALAVTTSVVASLLTFPSSIPWMMAFWLLWHTAGVARGQPRWWPLVAFREHDLELVSDTAIRNLVLWSPHAPPGMWIGEPYLSDDGLHPNTNGNKDLAERVAKALAGMYGEEIRAVADQD